MLPEVLNRLGEYVGIVLEVTQAKVAAATQQLSSVACCVIVVQAQDTVTIRLTADGAQPSLPLVHR